MTGDDLSDSEFNVQPPQMPARNFPAAAAAAAPTETDESFNRLHDQIMTPKEGIELSSSSEPLALVQEVVKEEKAPPEEPPPPVSYKVSYHNDFSVLFSKEDKEPIAVQSTLLTSKNAVIEVITDVKVHGPSKYWKTEKGEPRAIGTVLRTSLKINSPAIITALQSLIEYYPSHSFSEASNIIAEPYAPLIHHEEQLRVYRDRFHPDKINSEENICQRNTNAYDHLGILQDVLFERSGREVEAERQRHARGVATFEMLWLLLRPGADVYYDFYGDGSHSAAVIKSVSGGMFGGPPVPLEIQMWSMDYDGTKFGRRTQSMFQFPYDGENVITSLVVYPCEFWRKGSGNDETQPLKKKLEGRGKMFFRLAQRQCMDYDGVTGTWPKKHVKGLTMVDLEVYYEEATTGNKPTLGEVDDTPAHGVSECLCLVCLKSKPRGIRPRTSRYSTYENLFPETTELLTSHQYFLCPRSVRAYVFKSRTWEFLEVESFSDPTFDTTMIDTLVLKEERRRLIKALAKNYQTGADPSNQAVHKPWAADFVAGKGDGRIFLLHGKPGVGKTYTAECIAAYTKRPLLSLTISDIGTEPSQAEASLNLYFTRAKQWNAILLIDEADIYMERREVADLTRNSLVSGFLRAMENCQSILFLTTNRVGSFDDAFVSRIHISLYYRDFTEEERCKVWTTFFNKLARDRKNVMHVPVETILYTTGPEVANLKWNGREIRNAFQTAVALADFDNEKNEDGKIILHKRHIQQIVNMSKEFKDYLRELHRGDEAKRADRQRIRYDEFDQKR